MLRCEAIACASDRITGAVAGGEDYTAALGGARCPGSALTHARNVLVTVASAYGLPGD